MLTARSMEKNLTITGIEEEKNENCKEKVIAFLKGKVEIDAGEDEILVAHRIGQYNPKAKKPRIILARCVPVLKQRIFKNMSNLKDNTNSSGDYYYINKQLPEKYKEQNREIREIIKDQKAKDEALPPKDRSKIEVKNKKVYIDSIPVNKYIHPVEVCELFPESMEREKQDKLKLATSDTVNVEGSNFVAYAIKTGQTQEVRRAYHKIRRTHPGATHVIAAYKLRSHSGYQDDEEHTAGHKLVKEIERKKMINVAVFVVRDYGGTHLGHKRFSIICEAAEQALSRLGN